jgi:hypothetical protein
MTPFRFQRVRGKRGWKMPDGGKCCDKSRGGVITGFDWRILGRAEAARLYKAALLEGRLLFTVEDVRRELRGRPLGCYCPLDQACHVDVLLEIANR